jgi:hypothetical protein
MGDGTDSSSDSAHDCASTLERKRAHTEAPSARYGNKPSELEWKSTPLLSVATSSRSIANRTNTILDTVLVDASSICASYI